MIDFFPPDGPTVNPQYQPQYQPQRPWVGLTEDEMNDIYKVVRPNVFEFWKRCEAKLKEKNHG